jgi:hypothetical protein
MFYRQSNWVNLGICVACLLFVATVRQGNVYWPFINVPILIYLLKPRIRLHPAYRAFLGLTLLLGSVFVSFVGAKSQYADWQSSYEVNQYNSLFLGALKFSKDPGDHLKRIGLENAVDCVGVSPYSPPGIVCFNAHQGQLSFLKVLDVIIHEPRIFLRQILLASGEMQDITVEYLGKYSIYDPNSSPRIKKAVNERYFGRSEMTLFNIWANLKYYFFPRKYFLLLYLGTAFIVFLYNFWKGSVVSRELSLVGLVATMATLVDFMVTILGGGEIELIKHLFSANLLFDISLIAMLGLVCVFIKARAFGK